jgi:hypothetical protein
MALVLGSTSHCPISATSIASRNCSSLKASVASASRALVDVDHRADET